MLHKNQQVMITTCKHKTHCLALVVCDPGYEERYIAIKIIRRCVTHWNYRDRSLVAKNGRIIEPILLIQNDIIIPNDETVYAINYKDNVVLRTCKNGTCRGVVIVESARCHGEYVWVRLDKICLFHKKIDPSMIRQIYENQLKVVK